MSLNWHCVISQWCLHIGRCCHYRPHSSWFVSRVTLSHGVTTIVTAHVKNGLYCKWFPSDMFFLLTIKVFKCLHQQADKFLHQCANMAWGDKGIGSLLLSILHAFYRQKMSVALQVVSILRSVIVVGEGSSTLGVLSRGPPLSLFDMLLATRGCLGTWCSLVVCPLLLVFLSSWMWVLPISPPCIPPFLGALIYLWLARFHH